MKKNPVLFTLTTLAVAGAAQAVVAEADCLTGNYGAGVNVEYTNSKCVATIDADGDNHNNALNLPTDNTVTVDSVHYSRTSTATGKAQTVVFPFEISRDCSIQHASFYKFDGDRNKIYQNSSGSGNKWVGYFRDSITVSGDNGAGLQSYYPYVFKFDDQKYFDISGCTMEFKSGNAVSYTFDAPGLNGKWELNGAIEKITWAEGSSELGVIYGFSAKKDNSIGIDYGQFVKAAAGASVPPLRAYLKFNKTAAAAKASADAAMLLDVDEEDLPSTIEVVFEDEEGTQSIGTLNTRTGEIAMDKDLWFDMKGRKFNKEPMVKGTYYNQGKKVIVK